MTEQQARQLVKHVRQEAPKVYVIYGIGKSGRDENGYRVRFQLGHRVLFANQPEEWEEIKHAWQYFYLPEEAWKVPEREQPIRYLVDDIPMLIKQDKLGYWRATYQRDGRTHKMYWGEDDPRGRYPVLGDREVPR